MFWCLVGHRRLLIRCLLVQRRSCLWSSRIGRPPVISMASGVKAPLPKSKVTISLEKIMAPMVAGITSKLITGDGF